MDFLEQMVPLIFTLAHFASSFASCVTPFNPYQSHVVMFYNFPQQDIIIHLLSLGHRSRSLQHVSLNLCHQGVVHH
jgi:hypothetical protein